MATSTLADIRQKVRMITRSPSPSQITDAQLDQYINTFLLYDLPYNLRIFSLKSTLQFYTRPNIDTYGTSTDASNSLYDFKNRYLAVHPPVYVAGYPSTYTQDRSVFYTLYPQINAHIETGSTGTGVALTFTGTSNARPILQNSVAFSATSSAGATMVLIDYPQSDSIGNLGLENVDPGAVSPYGTINYITGVYSVTFPVAPAAREPIMLNCIKYQAGRPFAMLFFDNKFILRPVPDDVYVVQVEVDVKPTELINASDDPMLNQWWQYIAIGAAKKIFEDRLDYESIQALMPIFNEQQSLVMSTPIVQQCNSRTETIYTSGRAYNRGWFPFWPY